MAQPRPVRRGAQLALAFAVIAAALIVAVALISYAKTTNQLQAVSLAGGNEYMVSVLGPRVGWCRSSC